MGLYMKKITRYLPALFLVIALLYPQASEAVRLKDIAQIKGVRGNQLVGYGLIVGLDGTGDGKKSTFTLQSMATMLENMGITVAAGDIAVSNVAAVMATAELPAFARSGSRIDVLVSSIGDAKNLQGGTLLMTPLKAADGRVYAVAQGPVNTGGFGAAGAGGSVQKNFPTVGRVVSGALIEREPPNRFSDKKMLTFSFQLPDFTTVSRVAETINDIFYDTVATAKDAGSVQVVVPEKYKDDLVGFVATLEAIEVVPDNSARIVINERTGTVVMGENVRISTLAIAHGNLSIVINESADVSQPLPLSDGATVVTPETEIGINEEAKKLILMKEGVSIGQVVKALNALGVTPRDLIAIFQAIKAAGALQAKLEVI